MDFDPAKRSGISTEYGLGGHAKGRDGVYPVPGAGLDIPCCRAVE